MQLKCAWEHGLCANVYILDHDVTKYKTEYDLVKVPTWNFPQNLDREKSVKRPWKTRETAVKKPVRSHQKLAPKFYSFFWVFCSLLTGFSLKSLEPLVISSSLATYRLEIGWCAAVVAESVECMWGLAGFPLYMLFIYIYTMRVHGIRDSFGHVLRLHFWGRKPRPWSAHGGIAVWNFANDWSHRITGKPWVQAVIFFLGN